MKTWDPLRPMTEKKRMILVRRAPHHSIQEQTRMRTLLGSLQELKKCPTRLFILDKHR